MSSSGGLRYSRCALSSSQLRRHLPAGPRLCTSAMHPRWLWTVRGASGGPCITLLPSLLFFLVATAKPTNRTIDDQWGDSVTGALPVYSANWNYGPDCTVCQVVPSQSMAFENTWHDTTSTIPNTSGHSVTLGFTGRVSYSSSRV